MEGKYLFSFFLSFSLLAGGLVLWGWLGFGLFNLFLPASKSHLRFLWWGSGKDRKVGDMI